MSNLIEHMRKFVAIQTGLIHALCDSRGGLEQSGLDRIPRAGSLVLDDNEWYFHKHGSGVSFKAKKDGTVIDAHVETIEAPDAIDAWRLFQYFESIGVSCVECCSTSRHDVTSERQIEAMLAPLLEEGRLIALKRNGLYRLSTTYLIGSR
jgi:hypothetical protein